MKDPVITILNNVNDIIQKYDFFEIDEQYENETNFSYSLQLINKYNKQEVLVINYDEPYYEETFDDEYNREYNREERFEMINYILDEFYEYINLSYLIRGIYEKINELKKYNYFGDLSPADYNKPIVIKRFIDKYLPFDKEQYVNFVKKILKYDLSYANKIIKEYLTPEYYNKIEYLLNASKFDLI